MDLVITLAMLPSEFTYSDTNLELGQPSCVAELLKSPAIQWTLGYPDTCVHSTFLGWLG